MFYFYMAIQVYINDTSLYGVGQKVNSVSIALLQYTLYIVMRTQTILPIKWQRNNRNVPEKLYFY